MLFAQPWTDMLPNVTTPKLLSAEDLEQIDIPGKVTELIRDL